MIKWNSWIVLEIEEKVKSQTLEIGSENKKTEKVTDPACSGIFLKG